MNETVENRVQHPMVLFKRDMESMIAKELDMLDDRAKMRMRSAAIVAVTKDPELLLADRQSFMGAIRMCAQHGVTPDGNEAVLQVYNTKVKSQNGQESWIKKVTYLPMIRGIVNRVERSGKIKPFYAEVVFEHESFSIDTSFGDRRPVHQYDPMRRGKDSEIIGAYSVARYLDGVIDCEVMPREQIEKVKAAAKTKNVWDGWYAEKAKVAVMKRHSKRLPLSADDMDFILNRDETDFDQSPRDITPNRDGPNLAQRLIGKPPAPEDTPPADDAGDQSEIHWTISIPTDEAFPGTDEFDQGVKALHANLPYQDNPYPNDAQKSIDWAGGWLGAQNAAGK